MTEPTWSKFYMTSVSLSLEREMAALSYAVSINLGGREASATVVLH